MTKQERAPSLNTVIKAVEQVAPPDLAAEWDNTGLLLDQSKPARIRRILLTLDLTPAVLSEALHRRADLVVAYHPVIFAPLTRLDRSDPKSESLLRAARRNIAVYCPHTALDAVPGGLSDWLAEGVGNGFCRPLEPLPAPLDERFGPEAGMGRSVSLKRPVGLHTIVRRLKAHLGLSRLRIARPERERTIEHIALCPGAGASLLRNHAADLYVTGEMRHHDILDAVQRGIAVILCEHAQSERGFLPHFADQLRTALPAPVALSIAEHDLGPIGIA